MKKNTLAKSLLFSFAAVTLMSLVGCESGPLSGKKPMKPEKKMSEPASKYHPPSETKGKYPPGQGEPRMKQHSPEEHQRREFQSEPHPPQRQQNQSQRQQSQNMQ